MPLKLLRLRAEFWLGLNACQKTFMECSTLFFYPDRTFGRDPKIRFRRITMKHLLKTVLATSLLLLAACGTTAQPPQPQPQPQPSGKPFSYSLDAALKPNPEVRGDKTVAAAKSEGGITHLFIANEMLIAPKDQAELDGFLARTNGILIGNDAVPEAPQGSGVQIKPEFKIPTQYIVKVDPSRFDLANLNSDAQKSGLSGATLFSSDSAARLLAGVVHEKANGLKVSPNFVAEGSDLLRSTQEQPIGGSFDNAFTYSRFFNTGSRSSVLQMYQLVAAQGPARRSTVAIVDGGFWLDGTGRSLSADLPGTPLQYDFNGDDYIADGMGLASCSGGSSCPWHGTGAAHVAVGAVNNRFGAAGTGGQVADPMLFKTSLDWGQTARAIRTAVAWRADVISMSFGAGCDNVFCDGFFEFNLYPALRNARDNGVVMVAAAGNDGGNANSVVPCKASEDVICVGALGDDVNTAMGYSNFGSAVDIWAPTNINAVYGGSLPLGVSTFGGTSAATPFVAGVAAVLRAYSPSLTSAQVNDLLRPTAWTDSSDSKVSHYINAYRALREVVRFTPDRLEANNTAASASAMGTLGSLAVPLGNLNLHSSADRDHYRFTVSDYSSLAIQADFIADLGDLNLSLIKESGASGVPEGLSNTPNPTGRLYSATLLPPGTYRLIIAPTSTTNAYNLFLRAEPRPMSPDGYEVNNSLITARGLATGSFNANLHNLTDVDYYWFNPTLSTLTSFRFSVTSRDMSLTLRLFDNSDSEISSLNCNSSAPCALNIPSGVHKVKVEPLAGSASRGRYTFSVQYQIDSSIFLPDLVIFPDNPIFWINPGDPAIPEHLIGLQDVFAFQQVGKASKGILIGQGLKLSLLDKTGKLIQQGTPSTNPQLPGSEVSLSGLQNNGLYVLVVERLNAPSVIDNETETLGSIPYSLDLGN